MSKPKAKVRNVEDIQYRRYVVEKVGRGLDRTKKEGAIPHKEAKKRLRKWLSG